MEKPNFFKKGLQENLWPIYAFVALQVGQSVYLVVTFFNYLIWLSWV